MRPMGVPVDFVRRGRAQRCGPMAVLAVDCESATAPEEAGVALGRTGAARRLKALGQRAQVGERRREIPRCQLRPIDAHCRESGVQPSFARRLAEAARCKNCAPRPRTALATQRAR